MSDRMCGACGQIFYAEEPWKKLCLDCFIKKKRAEVATQDWRAELIEAQAELRLVALQRDNLASALNAEKIKRNEEAKARQATRIEPEMLRRLTMLCHPDRHANSPGSHAATVWLLSQRVAE
jgi:hypothetical protein